MSETQPGVWGEVKNMLPMRPKDLTATFLILFGVSATGVLVGAVAA